MTSQVNYDVRRIGETEFNLVKQVFDGTRNISSDEAYFRQKFKGVSDDEFISVAHFDGSKPISHCASIPYTFTRKDSEKLTGGQVCDAVTLPDYQRKGLFSSLNDEILNQSIAENVDFLFRFPSAHNYQKVIGKFGFTHVDDFHTFEFNFRYVPPALKLFEKFNWKKVSKTYLKLLSTVTFSRNSIVRNSMEDDRSYAIPHGKRYFDYKTYSESYRINVFGDKYWAKHGDGLIIGDFNIRSKKSFMRKLKVFCFFAGIHKVRFNVCGQSEEFAFFSKLTSPESSIPICVRLLNEDLDIDSIKFTFADNDTF